jgi:hypothetical protein
MNLRNYRYAITFLIFLIFLQFIVFGIILSKKFHMKSEFTNVSEEPILESEDSGLDSEDSGTLFPDTELPIGIPRGQGALQTKKFGARPTKVKSNVRRK